MKKFIFMVVALLLIPGICFAQMSFRPSGGSAVSGTDTYVCFFDGASASCSDAGLAYDKSTDELTAKGGILVGDGTDKDVTVFTVNIAGTDVTGKWNQTTGQLEFSVPIKGGGTSNTISFDDGASPDTDETVIGTVMPFTANENQGFGDVVYINGDGEMQLADADAIASSYVLAMATEDITADSSGFYLMPGGIARDDTWNWTVGEPIYLSTTGTTGNTLTQTAPSGEDDAIVIIGVATHSDRMYFFPQLTIIEYTAGS
jgi:hypothetical protein